MTIKMIVNGRIVEPQSVAHRQLGFGQNAGCPTQDLEILIPKAVLLEILEAPYALYVAENRDMWEDDQDAGDLLQAAGYPPLLTVMETPELLEFVLLEYLKFEFLEAVADSPRPEWVINDVRSIGSDEYGFRVMCSAYKALGLEGLTRVK